MSNQQSCSALGSVCTWMCDYLHGGELSWYETSQLGRLCLLFK